MGYSHYYKVPKKLNSEKFKALSEELKTVSGLLPTINSGSYDGKTIVLADGDGEGQPQFTDELIRFNGTEKDDMYHETFEIAIDNSKSYRNEDDENGLIFNYCKTARKPYDIMVCVSLLRLKHHFPQCEISSDGTGKDWNPAKNIYKKAFGGRMPKVN